MTWDHIAHSPSVSIAKAERLLGYSPRVHLTGGSRGVIGMAGPQRQAAGPKLGSGHWLGAAVHAGATRAAQDLRWRCR